MISTFITIEGIKKYEILVFHVNQEHKPVVIVNRREVQLEKNWRRKQIYKNNSTEKIYKKDEKRNIQQKQMNVDYLIRQV
jgi:hypothetical protein